MHPVEREKENHIGFGQLVPLLLIVLATFGATEAYMCRDTYKREEQDRRSSESTMDYLQPPSPAKNLEF